MLGEMYWLSSALRSRGLMRDNWQLHILVEELVDDIDGIDERRALQQIAGRSNSTHTQG